MANTTTSSLLVSEEEGSGVPALGGTDSGGAQHQASEDFQSPLERLIAQSTSEQRGDSFGVQTNLAEAGMTHHLLWSPVSEKIPIRPPSSLLTLLACICCLLQAGFCWASFLSPSWLETRLYLSIGLPSIHIETSHSQLLHTTTLGSLLGDLLGADQHWAAVGLVMTSLVLPCLCVVTGAVWIVEDRKEQDSLIAATSRRRPNRKKSSFGPRIFLEYGMRLGFVIFFIFCILTIGSSPLEIEYSDSKFIVVNQFEGGLTAYTLGMMFGLVVLALLRFGRSTTDAETLLESTGTNTPGPEYSWEVHSNELFTGIKHRREAGNEDGELQTPLLQDHYNNMERPSTVDKSTETLETDRMGGIQTDSDGLPFWKRVVLFELALVSTLFWIPALFLPLFQLKYEGFVSDFISNVSLSFRLGDFPIELWKRGISAGTNPLMLLVLEDIFVILVLAGPILANLAAIGAWILESQARIFCRRLLWILQPFLGTLVFGTALYFAIPAFETVTEGAINNFGDGICANFESVVGEVCFTIKAQPSAGLWFVLIESLALELFVLLTLSWWIQ